MAQNLSRRKYSAVISYLTAVMKDPREASKSRMAAALRLADVMERADERAERAHERQYRKDVAALKAMEPNARSEGAQRILAAMDSGDPDETVAAKRLRIQGVFDSVLGRGPSEESHRQHVLDAVLKPKTVSELELDDIA